MAEPMELTVHRTKNGEKSCTGTLDIDGVHECYTLEDPIRKLGPKGEGKIWGETGIPEGRYKVTRAMSPKFGRMMPLLLNVPFFTGILIHSGNKAEHTEGCLLVGQQHLNDDWIQGGSVEAPLLHAKLFRAMDEGREVWITYINEFPEPLR